MHQTIQSNTAALAPQNANHDFVARTMSSREIASLTGKRHANVKRDIVAMLAELKADVLSFEHIYLDGQNREQVEYLLDREHTDCLLTGYSAGLRMKVIRRWRELEGQSEARQAVMANGTKVIGEIAIMECFTRLLKPAASCLMQMLTKIAEDVRNGRRLDQNARGSSDPSESFPHGVRIACGQTAGDWRTACRLEHLRHPFC